MTRKEYIALMEEYELALQAWHDIIRINDEMEDNLRRLFTEVAKSIIEEEQ